MDEKRRRTLVWIGLVVLAVPQLAIGVWALASPRGWFGAFPGGGRVWLPLYGPYDEHLVYDVASTFLAVGVVLLLAAWWLDSRDAVRLAAVGYLVFQVPHAVYHWGADGRLPGGDEVLNGVGLGLSIVIAVGLLALSRGGRPRTGASDGTAASEGADPSDGASGATAPSGVADAGPGRLGPPPRGLLARGARWYGRRRFGQPPATVDAYLHQPRLLMGYGSFENAVERSHRVDERLKALAELKAAAVVGCEWCMDFGSWLARRSGVPEEQLRELPRYRESDAFSPFEKLVLDYATAMTRTPADVDDDLFTRLREHFDDAQLVELTNVIAVENMRGRFNHALDLEPQDYSRGGVCVVPERPEEGAVVSGAARS